MIPLSTGMSICASRKYDIPEGFPDNATDLVTRVLVRCHVIIIRLEPLVIVCVTVSCCWYV